jgi:MFS family permease
VSEVTARETTTEAPPGLDRSLLAALIGNFLIRLDGGMVGLLITLYLAEVDQRGIIEVSATTLGILSSLYYIVELGFAPVMGVKSDQYGNRTMLLVGPIFGVVAVLFASVAAFSGVLGISQVAIAGISIMLLALGVTRLMQGFAAAASIPSILSYLSVRTEGSLALRGRVMSVFEITTAIGLLVGPVIGAQLWKFTGPWGFLITGLCFLASAAVFMIVREDRASNRRVTTTGGEGLATRLKRVLRRRDLLVFAPAWMAVNAIVGMWGVHLVYQMKNGELGDSQFLTGRFSEDTISAVLVGYGLLFCAGVVAWGFTLGRLREVSIMRLSAGGLFVLCGAIYGINMPGGTPLVIGAFTVLAGLGLAVQSGFAPAAVTYLARLAAGSAQDRGLFMGIYSVVLGLGQFIGIWLGGPFADAAGVNGILLLTLILGVIATITIFRLAPQSHEAETTADEVRMGLHA